MKASADLPWGDGVGTVLGATAIWGLAAALALRRALRPPEWAALGRLSAATAWTVAAALALGTLLCVTDLGSVSVTAVVLGAALLAAAVAAHDRLDLRLPRRPWGAVVDVAIVGLVLLAVPDLVIVQPENASGSLSVQLHNSIIQFHQNFFLGPANEILHGRAMLVDATSQYGVGSIYFLTGWFQLAPIGYGTLGFISGLLTALVFAAGYCVLRMAGASRLLSGAALAAAVAVLVLNLPYPVDSLPQDSSLRIGIPMAAILALVAAERWPRHARLASGLAVGVVGLSSIWSLEGFAYTLFTFAAMVCVQAWLRPAADRVRWLARQALWVAVACAGAHLALAVATLAATGELPDWGQYLEYLDAFLFGRLGDLNYDYGPWPAGLPLGAVYLASAAAIALLALRRRDFLAEQRVAMVALAGLTAYGIASYTYYNNRSSYLILAAVALPALLAGALWLSLVLRSRAVPVPARRGALAFGGSIAILLVAVAWSSIDPRYPRSALAHAFPGGDSLRGALERLWDLPPLSPAAPEGEVLLDRYFPGENRPLVIVKPDLETEILVRSDRGNMLPLAAPWQDSFVPSVRLPDLRRSVASLRAGQRMLVDANTRQAFATFRGQPSKDPFGGDEILQSLGATPSFLAPLQLWTLKQIQERFDLRTIGRSPSGLEVVELVPRAAASPEPDSNR